MMDRPQLKALAIVAAVVFLLASASLWGMVRSARADLAEFTREASGFFESAETSIGMLESARERHAPSYLEAYDSSTIEEQKTEIERLLASARGNITPDQIRAKIREARTLLIGSRQTVGTWSDEIILLDTAKKEYQQVPVQIMEQVGEVRRYIEVQVNEGYFPDHFNQAESTLGQALAERKKALDL